MKIRQQYLLPHLVATVTTAVLFTNISVFVVEARIGGTGLLLHDDTTTSIGNLSNNNNNNNSNKHHSTFQQRELYGECFGGCTQDQTCNFATATCVDRCSSDSQCNNPNDDGNRFCKVLLNVCIQRCNDDTDCGYRETCQFVYFSQFGDYENTCKAAPCSNPNPNIDGYNFYSQQDSQGYDLGLPGFQRRGDLRNNVIGLQQHCNQDPACVAFNTDGWFKSQVRPMAEWDLTYELGINWIGGARANTADWLCPSYEGLYVKNTVQVLP